MFVSSDNIFFFAFIDCYKITIYSCLNRYLLKKGADPKIKDNDGYTPVDLAYINSREASIKLLDPDGTHVLV